MANDWESERLLVEQFARDLESRPPLTSASTEDLEAHARQIAHMEDLLGLVAALPAGSRPPVARWDDVLGPLWRRLFAKGADIDRLILADLWCPVLREAGEKERFLRACTAVAASSRNAFRFSDALQACGEGREVGGSRPSAALANLLNTEGSVLYTAGDYDGAENRYREALAMVEGLDEGDVVRWVGVPKADLIAQEWFNIMEANVERGCAILRYQESAVRAARTAWARLEEMDLSEGFSRWRAISGAGLAMLEGRHAEAAAALEERGRKEAEAGPYQYSMRASHDRLMSRNAALQGDWSAAYRWIRSALKTVVTNCYPGEEQFVVDQAVAVLRGLHERRDTRAQEELVQDLVQLLEDKDWYTGRSHSRSVSRLCFRIGQKLREERAWDLDLDQLKAAGLLHDVGKLRIPWSLLNKIAPITPKEQDILKDHSALGGSLLRAMGLNDVARIVEQHHECVDGTGYPSGTAPEGAAAIVAVCDAYEATITPNRRYKQPKTRDTALAELLAGSGRRYHGTVVEALMELLQREPAQAPP